MTVSRTVPSTRRSYTGTISKLVVSNGFATATFTRRVEGRSVRTRMFVPGGILTRLTGLKEGQITLYGEMKPQRFVVLGDDRRPSARNADMGPSAPMSVYGTISGLQEKYNRRAGRLYLLGRITYMFANIEITNTFLARGGVATALQGVISNGPVIVTGVQTGDVFEAIGLEERMPHEASAPTGRTRREPDHQVTLIGNWRTLKPHQIGKGPDGHLVIGKTWVRAHKRYAHKPLRQEVAA